MIVIMLIFIDRYFVIRRINTINSVADEYNPAGVHTQHKLK